ncbi:MAG: peptidoglycan-binding protein [Dermatophilaceae bacterium]|jgi:peptidoglycan hydrolase-like protein with peptidoglycan-binding domain|nr:peptidoglycan-binding protein [Dermatophilaceae bacterium]
MNTTRRHVSLRFFVAAALAAPLLLLAAPAPDAVGATRTCSSTTAVANRPTLRYGDTGSCVKVLQNILLGKGYSIGSSYATGTFGSGTLGAVRRYQSTKLTLVIDGVVGPTTWNRLVNGGGTTYSISSGPNTSSRVILSFDDCPKSYSAFQSAVLGAKSLGVALVLAPTGNCISAGRFSPSYARANGHYVINHSISHPNLSNLSYSSVRYQLGSPGVVTSYGRPPYGSYDFTVRDAYASKGMRIWTWDVDTSDYTGRTQAQVVNHVVTYSRAGDTVLMHMGWNAFNKSAIAAMKSGLAAKGLGVCRNPGTTTPTYPKTIGC